MPADKLGLNGRGLIKKGNYADLVIFDANKISDKATFVNPHQLATGIDYVFVNGKAVIVKGMHLKKKSGKVMRHLDT